MSEQKTTEALDDLVALLVRAHPEDSPYQPEIAAAVSKLRSALAQAPAPSGEVPEGWVLVPKEATWEMQQAALDASRKLGPLVGLGRGEYVMPKPAELWCSAFIYKAMIAAAPKGASK